jgi:hypothetical protein
MNGLIRWRPPIPHSGLGVGFWEDEWEDLFEDLEDLMEPSGMMTEGPASLLGPPAWKPSIKTGNISSRRICLE